MKIEAAARLRASLDPRVFYRGLQEKWDAAYERNQHLIFITPDKDYAAIYAKDEDHIVSFHADLGEVFDFGFRSLRTQVQLSEVLSRVKAGILEQFRTSKISKAEGLKLVGELNKLSHGDHKEVWEWYMHVPGISGPLVQILSDAHFNSIGGREDTNDSTWAYGVFSYTQLRKIT